ncbi:MAG: hypothetical protein IKV73_05560 [Clostridia bacterium]|nr:hypothetical protein [Clostridia bacterium]
MYASNKKQSAKKRKNSELKLIGLLLIAGNTVVLRQLDVINFDFAVRLIESAIVATAMYFAAALTISFVRFFKTA